MITSLILEKLVYLKPNIPLIVGRTKGDIILPHDASISKLHASFVVKTEMTIMKDKATTLCILKDEGSKYGIYIFKNDKYERVLTYVHLKDQDKVRIGLQKEIFVVKYIPMITLTSGLEEKEKDKLEQIMKQIDGIILTNWQNYCTHLTVLSPKLTEKVAVALAAGIMIVTVDYWKAVKYAMENDHHPIPKINNFVPRIKEEYIPKGLVSLYANDKRKKLFRKKIFFFYELKQYETYRLMIKLAGGDSNFIDLKCKQNFSIGDNIIHIKINKDDEDSAVSKTFKRNHDYIIFTLQRYKKRFIPDSEIPLAILFCSIEKYCNQKYHFSNVFKNEKQFDYFLPETLVMDTQDLELETEEVPSSMYKIQKDKVKKLSKFFDNNDISNEKSPSEKSNDEMHQIAISDNEEIPNSPVQPTTSLSSFSPKRIELEESNSKNVFVDNIEIDEIKLNEEQGTSTKNKSQSLEKQQETTIPLESSPSETRNNLQNENTAENPSTSETSIYKRSVGKTFQKAHVKIPEKRIRL